MFIISFIEESLQSQFHQEVAHNYDKDDEDINKFIRIGTIIMFILYGLLLLATTYNTVKFVFGSSRYQNFHITYFYVLVYLVIILRLGWLSLILYVADNEDEYVETIDDKDILKSKTLIRTLYYFDVIATYLELLIGIQ